MESKIANASKRSLIESHRRLTPQERLEAFLAHCRAMARLKEAGTRDARSVSTGESLLAEMKAG